jgi:hypothetical protein
MAFFNAWLFGSSACNGIAVQVDSAAIDYQRFNAELDLACSRCVTRTDLAVITAT